MAESAEHMKYVSLIKEYAKSLLPSQEHIHMIADTPFERETPPHVENNYRPDFYYCHNFQLIIGEAKTDDDFNRQHSLDQYLSYLQECQRFLGDSTLILSGSWRISASFANLIRNLQRQNDIKVHVVIINELGLYREYQ
ncbi:MAG: hypothetical protein IKB00_10315 [Bacteroidaceae bacterium]|nr:hypothetical protein [Bacteroidaceae bacterium]